MRNFILIITFALSAGTLFAHSGHYGSQKSDLNVKMWDNSIFTIKLDNHVYKNQKNFHLKNVSPGSHYVKIIKKKRKLHGHGFFVKTVYQGYINIPSRRKVKMSVKGNHLSFKFFKKSHHNHHGNGYAGNYGTNPHSNHGYGFQSDCMNESSFNRLLKIMQNATFDDDKLNVVKQAVALNYFSVNQVGVIMDQFTFDDSKLEFSKLAYNKTVDKENYFVVSSKFTFSRSAKKLSEYISHIS
ncbi:MAG: DUF4476 domain-containing protein [Flavobacteriales bacterium]|nr:DUF4476 domain-containing protein [Flavobacteriales bacterium]